MTTPATRSSGAVTTTGIAISTGTGSVSFAQASTGGTLRVYDGASSAGTLLAAVPVSESKQFNPPVRFGTGLWLVPSTTIGSSDGSVAAALVHYE